MPEATTIHNLNKKFNLKTSRLMRRFCKLFPDYKWCQTNANPNNTIISNSTSITNVSTISNKDEVIKTNTNYTSIEFGNEITNDGNVSNHESTYFMVSSTETSPTTTVLNNWTTRDNESFELTTTNAASETITLDDYEDLTTLPMTDNTDDEVSTPTTPESITNYESDSTASTTTEVLDNVTIIETSAASVSTGNTNSTIDSTEFATTTEVMDNVTVNGITTEVSKLYTDIYHLISFIIKQIIKHFYNIIK